MRDFSGNTKKLLENFLSLSFLQVVNLVIPFITLPYLVRVVGIEKFGLINFSLSIVAYFNILVSFGFELSATKQISVHRDDPKLISEIFSAVFFIKTGLFLVSSFILLLLGFFVDTIGENLILFWSSFGLVLGNMLFPTWFFQGMEKMKIVTIINVLTRTIFTLLIFVFVKKESDYFFVPVLNSAGLILGGITALLILCKNYDVQFFTPTKKNIFFQLKESYYYFISRIANSGSRYFATTIIGSFFGNTIVGYYSLIEKLFYAFTTIGGVVSQTIYPHMSRTKDLKLIKKILILTILIAAPICMTIMYYNEFIFKFIFDLENDLVSTIFLLVFSGSVFSIISSIVGYPLLAAFGYPKYANNSLIFSSIIYLIYISVATFLTRDIYYVSFSLVVYMASGLLFRLYYINKTGLLKAI